MMIGGAFLRIVAREGQGVFVWSAVAQRSGDTAFGDSLAPTATRNNPG